MNQISVYRRCTRWLRFSIPFFLFGACALQEPVTQPTESRTASITFKTLSIDDRLLENPEMALAELALRDGDPRNDGYARLSISKGGFAGLENFVREFGANSAIVKTEFEKFGIQYSDKEPESHRISLQAITDCMRYFPAIDRNRLQILPNLRQTAFIDSSGRPEFSAITWPPMISGVRDRVRKFHCSST